MLRKTIYIGNPACLSKKHDQLQIKQPSAEEDKAASTVPIEDIGLVVLDHPQITLTQPLLAALLTRAAVVICDERHLPYGLAVPLYGHTTYQEHLRVQLEVSVPRRKQLWQGTIKAKLLQQAGLLEQLSLRSEPLVKWSKSVRSGDPDNFEARGAAYYWNELFKNEIFVRGRDEAPPNNLLNFGYAILRSMVARALIGSGLSPSIGIFHRNRYNPFTLADDIMEPYRPYVDAIVYDLAKHGDELGEDLSISQKQALLQIATVDTYFDGRKSPLGVAIQRTTASVVRAYKGEDFAISYPVWTN